MSTLYHEDFESYANSAVVPALTTLGGSGLLVRDSSFATPVQGTKAYGSADADSAYCNTVAAQADCVLRISQRLVAGTNCIGHVLRANVASADFHYWFLHEYDGANLRGTTYMRAGRLITSASSTYNVPASVGDIIHTANRCVGTTLEFRVWVNSAAKPASPTVTLTDSTFSSGRFGLRRFGTYGV